jgi:RNA polymerase sigma-70 factor (ECF subfamily)
MPTTSLTLLNRLNGTGDGAAWSQFVEIYTPLLYFWANHTGLQPADAADLVQDVFAQLVRTLPEFAHESGKSFRGWLRMVTLNKWRERQRRAKLPIAEPARMNDVPADNSDQFWDVEYRQQLVARALAIMQSEFQPSTWRACWETVVCDRPAIEVGRELGLSEGAVYVARSRVLKRLRSDLAGLWD